MNEDREEGEESGFWRFARRLIPRKMTCCDCSDNKEVEEGDRLPSLQEVLDNPINNGDVEGNSVNPTESTPPESATIKVIAEVNVESSQENSSSSSEETLKAVGDVVDGCFDNSPSTESSESNSSKSADNSELKGIADIPPAIESSEITSQETINNMPEISVVSVLMVGSQPNSSKSIIDGATANPLIDKQVDKINVRAVLPLTVEQVVEKVPETVTAPPPIESSIVSATSVTQINPPIVSEAPPIIRPEPVQQVDVPMQISGNVAPSIPPVMEQIAPAPTDVRTAEHTVIQPPIESSTISTVGVTEILPPVTSSSEHLSYAPPAIASSDVSSTNHVEVKAEILAVSEPGVGTQPNTSLTVPAPIQQVGVPSQTSGSAVNPVPPAISDVKPVDPLVVPVPIESPQVLPPVVAQVSPQDGLPQATSVVSPAIESSGMPTTTVVVDKTEVSMPSILPHVVTQENSAPVIPPVINPTEVRSSNAATEAPVPMHSTTAVPTAVVSQNLPATIAPPAVMSPSHTNNPVVSSVGPQSVAVVTPVANAPPVVVSLITVGENPANTADRQIGTNIVNPPAANYLATGPQNIPVVSPVTIVPPAVAPPIAKDEMPVNTVDVLTGGNTVYPPINFPAVVPMGPQNPPAVTPVPVITPTVAPPIAPVPTISVPAVMPQQNPAEVRIEPTANPVPTPITSTVVTSPTMIGTVTPST